MPTSAGTLSWDASGNSQTNVVTIATTGFTGFGESRVWVLVAFPSALEAATLTFYAGLPGATDASGNQQYASAAPIYPVETWPSTTVTSRCLTFGPFPTDTKWKIGTSATQTVEPRYVYMVG